MLILTFICHDSWLDTLILNHLFLSDNNTNTSEVERKLNKLFLCEPV